MRPYLIATRRGLSFASLFVLGAFGLLGHAPVAFPQGAANAAAIVRPREYVSLDSVPRGSQFQVAVVVDIARGFHMNSHKPSDAYLIPTTLTPQLPPGLQLAEIVYPEGRSEKFSFSPDKPLNVYTGSVTLRLRLSADANAKIGATSLPLSLRYQACNDSSCLPPVRVPVNVSLQIAPSNTKPHAVHPEIFAPSPAK